MRARKLLSALTVAAALGPAFLSAPSASASTGVVSCETDSQVPGTNLYNWDCSLFATNPSNEVWRGPDLNRASNGTDEATGECKTVTQQYAYYITVTYTDNGVQETATAKYLCQPMF